MTDITKTNILERWDKLANADLGSWVSPVAAEIRDFFQAMFDGQRDSDVYTTNDFTSSNKIVCILRGFQINTGYYAEDGLTLSFSLDLHNVTMDSFMLKEFDDYLMARSPAYSGDTFTWLYRWQKLIAEESKPARSHKRKTA